MEKKKHIIQKLVVDVEYHGNMKGIELEQMISRWCREVLLPRLEQELEKDESPEMVTRINHVGFDVAVDSRDEWTELLLKKTAAGLKDKIDSCRMSAIEQQKLNGSGPLPAFNDKAANTVSLNSSDDFLEALIFYLENGNLPWWWDGETKLENVFSEWLEQNEMTGVPALKTAITGLRSATRLVLLCKPEQFPKILNLVHPERKRIVEQLVALIAKLAGNFPADKEQETITLFEAELLRYWYGSVDVFENGFLQVVHKWLDQICEEYELQTKTASGIKWKRELFQQLRSGISSIEQLLQPHLKSEENKSAGSESAIPAISISGMGMKSIEQPDILSNQNEVGIEEKISEDDGSVHTDQSIYIVNAGVILLAPLLPALFKRFDIISNHRINHPSLAVMALHYLTYGTEEVKEYEMPLYKILCGIPLRDAVNTRLRLDDRQKDEAREMLRSVIEHWSVLKDTSIEALRTAFLQRNGKLVFVNKEWKLMVEQKPYDMLLQQLPWSFQMIRLSWMNALLRTEWN